MPAGPTAPFLAQQVDRQSASPAHGLPMPVAAEADSGAVIDNTIGNPTAPAAPAATSLAARRRVMETVQRSANVESSAPSLNSPMVVSTVSTGKPVADAIASTVATPSHARQIVSATLFSVWYCIVSASKSTRSSPTRSQAKSPKGRAAGIEVVWWGFPVSLLASVRRSSGFLSFHTHSKTISPASGVFDIRPLHMISFARMILCSLSPCKRRILRAWRKGSVSCIFQTFCPAVPLDPRSFRQSERSVRRLDRLDREESVRSSGKPMASGRTAACC